MLKRYPEYKESGLEWIGEIPAHWEMINTKYLFRLVTEPAPKNNDYELLSIYTDIGVKPRKELEERGNRATTTDGYWLVKKGDFIVNKLLAWMGAIGLSNYEGVTSPAYDILRQIRPLNERFYAYLFRCGLYFTEFKKRSRGIMEVRLRLYFDQLGQIPLVFPAVDEQDRIAIFLDRKTGQIYELIRIKERKIELLREQRTALINQAVTKGLDPNVKMKPSGVEWIGEIPKDWNAVPMTKYLEPIIDYRGRTPEKTEDGRFLVTAKNIRNGRIDYKISQEFTSEDNYQRIMTRGIPQIGDVLFTTEAPLGEVANVDDVSIALAQRIIKFRPEPDFLNPYFLKYWILSYSFQSNLQRYATGSTAQGIKASKLCLLKLNLPPLKEQKQIVDYLDQKTQETNERIAAEQRSIELLKEYRQSLISDAVTGKIDVRSEV